MKSNVKLVIALFGLFLLSPVFLLGQGVYLDFPEAELEEFIKFISTETGKRFLYDSSVKGRKIYLKSTDPVSKDELYKIFLSVMEYNGYIVESAEGSGKIHKIKRNIQGPWTPTITLYEDSELEKYKDRDDFITMVINLKYISAREVQTTLRALRIVNPQGGNLAGIEGSNTILVTDYGPNVKRIYDVIQLMDQQGPQKEFRVIKLEYADAQETVEKLKEFVIKENRTGGGIGLGPNLDEAKLVADSRLGAIIVQAYSAKMQQIVTLINELDQGLAEEPSNIHYRRLKHADATELQEVLAKLIEGDGVSTGEVKSGSQGPDTSVPPAVEAEPQTNSLIVRANERDWREIQQIIEQVDVRRPQVMVEAALVELSPQDLLDLGVELFYATDPQQDEVNFAGNTGFGLSNLAAINGNTATPIVAGQNVTAQELGKIPLVNQGGLGAIQFDDSIFNLPVIVSALQNKANVKVVSLPSVVTNDNERAELKVADAQPSEVLNRGNNGNNDVQSFGGFEEAGTTLIITPHISGEKNYLRLDVNQTIEDFDLNSNAVGGVQAKRTRQLISAVTIPDGQTVAVGGLTFDSVSESVQKIPLLGDLPIIGFLFQRRIVNHTKRNIYLFITAKILREEGFKDFIQLSHEVKVKAQKEGVDISLIDESFIKYHEKYDLQKNELEPLFMLDYQSPDPQK